MPIDFNRKGDMIAIEVVAELDGLKMQAVLLKGGVKRYVIACY
jgi:hypothetical protein